MAEEAGVDPKRFRQALRDDRFQWHYHNERWTVESGSGEHKAMHLVLRKILK